MQHKRLSVSILVVTILLFAPQAFGISFNIAGSLGDLNGNGSTTDEEQVVNASLNYWGDLILTDRTFDLFVSSTDMGAAGVGSILDFNADNVPTSGTITLDTLPDAGSTWFVDPTPSDSSEFVVDPANPFHFLTGPEGTIDLLTVLLHEEGHALGFHSFGAPFFNPRYVSLMSPSAASFTEGERVYLQTPQGLVPLHGDGVGSVLEVVVGLSHTARADSGISAWTGSLMAPNAGFGSERWLPASNVEGAVFAAAYGDKTPSATVPEPSSMLLLGAGVMAAAVLKRKK